jgi:hypothetical protein
MAGVRAYGKITADCDDIFSKGYVHKYIGSVSMVTKDDSGEWKARGC